MNAKFHRNGVYVGIKYVEKRTPKSTVTRIVLVYSKGVQ